MAQYRRTRADATRQVFFDVLCLSEPKGLRFGLGLFRDAGRGGQPKVDPNGGFVAAAIDDNTPAHAADLEAHIGNTKNDDGTPLSEAVFQFYTYLMPRTRREHSRTARTARRRVSGYVYNKYGARLELGRRSAGRPGPSHGCQKNYMILVTGGARDARRLRPGPGHHVAGLRRTSAR